MNKMKIIIIFLLFVTIDCFSQNGINKIKFVFTEEGIINALATSCTVESFNEFENLDFKIIKEKEFLHKFANLFSKLEPDSTVFVIDARIMTIISYSDIKKKDTLCFGEYHGIDLNGSFMKDNSALHQLVRKKIWPRNISDSLMLMQ